MRVQKVCTVGTGDNAVTTITDYTLHGKLITHQKVTTVSGNETATEEMHFFYDNASRPAMFKYDGQLYTYVHNLQGDIVGIVDAVGNLVVEYKYDAWGKPLTEHDGIGKLSPFRYRGYVYDKELELYYMQCRYYSPNRERFISSDKLIGNASILMACNTYLYCMNAPITKIDADGKNSVNVIPAMPVVYDVPLMPIVHDIPISQRENKAIVSRHATNQLLLNTAISKNQVQKICGTYSNVWEQIARTLIWFKEQVDHNAVWDYKQKDRNPEWVKAHGVSSVTIDGIDMNMEEYGNFHYGFVGYAMGIPRELLIGGSIYAHYTSHKNFNEDPHDLEMINAGVNMAIQYQKNGLI